MKWALIDEGVSCVMVDVSPSFIFYHFSLLSQEMMCNDFSTN